MQTRKLTEVPRSEFSKEAAFIVEIDEEIKRVPSSEVRQLIEEEADRAETAEQMLSNRLVAEAARALAAEEVLDGKLSTETARAKSAEKANAETLQAESARAEEAEQKLTDDLANECARALEAEGILTSGLAAEAARAAEAETGIAERLELEILRAKAAEQTNADAVSKETVRAEERENEIVTSLAEEIVRAQAAESGIREELYTETARAGAADQELLDRIAAENRRAEAMETELQGNIDAHKAEVDGEIQSLKAADTALDEKKADAADVNRELGERYTKSQVFTKEEVLQKIEDLIGTAPDTLDTFKEIADALGNDPNFAATIMNALAGKVDKVTGKQLTSNDYSDSEKAIVADVNEKKHTHGNQSVIDKITQALLDHWSAAYTHVSDAVKHITAAERESWNAISNKVDKVSGKGLSANDYTTAEKNKLAGIAAGAKVNVQSDWNVTDAASDAFIKNKPFFLPADGGDADTAAKLKAARTINGVAFDGTQNITIKADTPISQLTDEPLNEVKTFGDYFAAGGNTVSDKPAGVGHFSLRVLRVAAGLIGQEINVDSRKWARMYESSTQTWTEWVEFFSEKHLPEWGEIAGKPAAFAPTSHVHTKSQISDMPTKLSQFTNDPGYITQADVDTSQNHTHSNKTVLDKVTQAMLDKLAGIAEGANKYIHPTTSGNKHIPSGGSSGQFLKWSADGTAVWAADNNTTYSAFKAASASAAGGVGLVPAPAAGTQAKYLRADGTWAEPPGTVYTHPNSGVAAGTYRSVTVNGQGHVTGGTNPTTLSGYGITDAAAKSHTHTAGEVTQDATHRFATDTEKTNWNKILFSAAISVPASGWSTSAPYTQTISVTGLTAAMDVVPMLNIAGSSTAAQVSAQKKALGMIDSGTTANGSVTFKCYAKKPAVDLPLYLKSV